MKIRTHSKFRSVFAGIAHLQVANEAPNDALDAFRNPARKALVSALQTRTNPHVEALHSFYPVLLGSRAGSS